MVVMGCLLGWGLDALMPLSLQVAATGMRAGKPGTVALERETGFEPATFCLGSRCSTPELLPPALWDGRAARWNGAPLMRL